MHSTNLINHTRKEYFILGASLPPDKISVILLLLEGMGWDLRLHNIYVQYGNKPQGFTQI